MPYSYERFPDMRFGRDATIRATEAYTDMVNDFFDDVERRGDECAICLDIIDTSSHDIVRLPCGHGFHRVCAWNLVLHCDPRSGLLCPMCRHGPIPVIDVRRLPVVAELECDRDLAATRRRRAMCCRRVGVGLSFVMMAGILALVLRPTTP